MIIAKRYVSFSNLFRKIIPFIKILFGLRKLKNPIKNLMYYIKIEQMLLTRRTWGSKLWQCMRR